VGYRGLCSMLRATRRAQASVRVHDVQNMADVMHVSDAIWGAT
jgi:dihydropteroate synthase